MVKALYMYLYRYALFGANYIIVIVFYLEHYIDQSGKKHHIYGVRAYQHVY